jgi:hypothetical protein
MVEGDEWGRGWITRNKMIKGTNIETVVLEFPTP